MRVRIILIVGLLFTLSNAFGQQGSGSMAVFLGATFSRPTVKNTLESYKFSNYSDGTISIAGQYNLKERLGIVLDVGICNRGMAVKQPVTLTSYDPVDGSTSNRDEVNKYRYSFSYLDNSLLAKYTLGNKVKVYANAGLYYSFLLKTKKLIVDEYYDTYGGNEPSGVHSQYANDLNYAYKKSDVGFVVGLGVERKRFALDYRYYMGAAEISKYPETISIHSSYSTLKLAYYFWWISEKELPHVNSYKKKSR